MPAFRMVSSRACGMFSGLLLLGVVACAPHAGHDPADDLRMNQIQVIGSHNSYKQAPEPKLLDIVTKVEPSAREWDYHHLPLGEQLDLGLRGLELDVYHDPNGGRYARPLGLQVLRQIGAEPAAYDPHGRMQQPGFKVLHVQDLDFRSNHLTLADSLRTLRSWSEVHPRHLPVIITMNTKDERIPLPGSVVPLAFDAAALDALDAALVRHLGRDKLITPDDVQGSAESLREAVLGNGWLQLGAARGRFLFVLDQGGSIRDAYLDGHAGLTGRVMFVPVDPDAPEAAVFIINDPLDRHDRIRELVARGFIVRTRADANTREARSGDRSRFEAATATGAHVISTDYYLPDERWESGYQVQFTGGEFTRANPVTAPGVLADPMPLEGG